MANLTRYTDIVPQGILPRFVDVWTPPQLSADARLPVIYMHDGQNLFEPGHAFGGEHWDIPSAVQRVMAERGLPGAIVVGIWNSTERWRDYAPEVPMRSIEGTPIWNALLERAGGRPQSDTYLRYLVEQLKPLVDRRHPTLPDREHTFVMGSSMGGLISLYAVEQYPEVFGGAACVSTHWPAGGYSLVDAMGTALPRADQHRLYFDYGTAGLDADYEPYQRHMDEYLRTAGYREGIDWVTLRFDGADHNEAAWRARLDLPLHFLLK